MNSNITTKFSTKQEATPFAKRVLPTVFSVNTLSGKLRHLGSNEKIPLCGSKLFSPELTDFEIKFENEELKEFWKSNRKGDIGKWAIAPKYEYCKRCLSVLKNF